MIAGSQWVQSPAQYRCVCGIWKISSCEVSKGDSVKEPYD